MTEQRHNVLNAALDYAQRGWFVFPVPQGTKKSHKSAAHSSGNAWGKTRDLDEIKSDWIRWPDANVGIPTGKENKFWVMEIDTPVGHGVNGIASLQELEARHGAIPPTRRAASPSGSIHYYFRWPDNGTEIRNSTSRIGPGIDVRGEGGMVIAPPSVRGDGAYRWLNDLDLADAPSWLVALVTANDDGERQPGAEPEADLARVAAALAAIPNADADWESWNRVGMATWRATGGSDAGLAAFDVWSKKSEKYNAANTAEKWAAYTTCPPTDIGAGTLFHLANAAGSEGVSLQDFYAYMPMHNYIFAPAREPWPAASVNARVPPVMIGEKPMPASTWIDRHQPVEQMTWAPGEPMLIRNLLVSHGGWIERKGVSCFNLYRPPTLVPGNAAEAGPWLDHVHKVFGDDDGRHIINWLAQRVQHPEEKINHALVLGSNEQGIGKDTLLTPVKCAVGPWNWDDISAQQLLGRFTGFLKSVILRVNEARDLGDVNRFQFYDHTKAYTAAPPDVLRIDEKHLREYNIFNCVGMILTTNHKTDGIYLPAEDRRHYVAWSDLRKEDFAGDYWPKLWHWYNNGGIAHVAAYLAQLDISDFDPKAPPPKTAAFWTIVNANRPSEEGELMDLIQGPPLSNPDAMTVHELVAAAANSFELGEWLSDRRNHRTIPHRLETCGYVPVRNDAQTDGRWKIAGRNVVVYAKRTLSVREQITAVNALKKRTEELLLSNPH